MICDNDINNANRKSAVTNDASLWSQNTINEQKFTYDRKEVNTAFTADKSVHDKTSHFDISARLSMDFMGITHIYFLL